MKYNNLDVNVEQSTCILSTIECRLLLYGKGKKSFLKEACNCTGIKVFPIMKFSWAKLMRYFLASSRPAAEKYSETCLKQPHLGPGNEVTV